jgi:hypothetical protein
MKHLTLMAGMLLAAGNLFAQTIIPHAGVTFSGSSFKPIDFSESSKSKPMVGFTIGAGYDLFINDQFSIMPEINFVQKGQISEDVAYPDGIEYLLKSEYRYNYLEIPVLAKFKFGGVTKFYALAGPSVAVGLGGKYKMTATFGGFPDLVIDRKVYFSDRPADSDFFDVYVDNKLDVGIQAGVGALLFGKATVDIRYTHGLTDLYTDVNSKNRVLQVSVGYPISLY